MPSVSTGLSLTLEAVFQKEQYNKNAKAILSHIEFQKQSNIGDRHHDQIAVPDLRWGKVTHL